MIYQILPCFVQMRPNHDLSLAKALVFCQTGGVQHNVVPAELAATFDVRLTPLMELQEFDRQVNEWIREAGEGVSIDYFQKHMDQVQSLFAWVLQWQLCHVLIIYKQFSLRFQTKTDISPKSKWWTAFSSALTAKNVNFKPDIFPAATDSRHLRYSTLTDLNDMSGKRKRVIA